MPVRIDEGILLRVLNCAARTGHTFLADQAWSILKDCMILPFSHEFSEAVSLLNFHFFDYFYPSLRLNYQLQNRRHPMRERTRRQRMKMKKMRKIMHMTKVLNSLRKQNNLVNIGESISVTSSTIVKHCFLILSFSSFLFLDKPMVESYHAFIEAQAKGGNVEKAFEALLELEENYPDSPQDLSPAQGLSMLADELAKDANTVDQAYFVLDEWHKAGKKVTVAMLDVIVAACSRMGDANRAFETFEAYPSLGITQRTESYNALMEVCAAQRQVKFN